MQRTHVLSAKRKHPGDVLEAIRYFSDLDTVTDFGAKPRGKRSYRPVCGCTEYSYVTTRRLWKCKLARGSAA